MCLLWLADRGKRPVRDKPMLKETDKHTFISHSDLQASMAGHGSLLDDVFEALTLPPDTTLLETENNRRSVIQPDPPFPRTDRNNQHTPVSPAHPQRSTRRVTSEREALTSTSRASDTGMPGHVPSRRHPGVRCCASATQTPHESHRSPLSVPTAPVKPATWHHQGHTGMASIHPTPHATHSHTHPHVHPHGFPTLTGRQSNRWRPASLRSRRSQASRPSTPSPPPTPPQMPKYKETTTATTPNQHHQQQHHIHHHCHHHIHHHYHPESLSPPRQSKLHTELAWMRNRGQFSVPNLVALQEPTHSHPASHHGHDHGSSSDKTVHTAIPRQTQTCSCGTIA